MIVTCWSTKGGSGTTLVACGLALVLGARAPGGSLLIDLCGDVPDTLQCAPASGDGLDTWLAQPGADLADLHALEQRISERVSIVPAGAPTLGSGAALAVVLATETRPVVVDAGRLAVGPGYDLAAGSTHSILVLRSCFVALRRATLATLRPSGVVLVYEPGRTMRARHVEAALGVPVVATIANSPAIAHAADAGLLESRVPSALLRPLAKVAA